LLIVDTSTSVSTRSKLAPSAHHKGITISSGNTAVINLTAQIHALATALRIVLDASPDAARLRERLTASLDQSIHDALEEGVWDNADGLKTIKAALLG